MSFMHNSWEMRKRSDDQMILALMALDAQFSLAAYNKGMQLKMTSTIVTHGVRSIMNIGFVVLDLFNMLYNIGRERSISAITGGLYAVATHFAAALVNVVNIFVTALSTLIRSFVSLVNGYKPELGEDEPVFNHRMGIRPVGSFFRAIRSVLKVDQSQAEFYENDAQRYSIAGNII